MKITPVKRKGPDAFRQAAGERPDLRLAADNTAPKETGFSDLLREIERLHQESARLRGQIADLERLADADVLLPMYNRRAFERELAREIALADRHRTPLSVVYIDLNGFKRINDSHGHAAGDAVLKNVADIINHAIRDTDVVGRLGGDEFGVILHRAGYDAAEAKASDLARKIAGQPIVYAGERCEIGASAGAVVWRKGETAEEIMTRADAAMYQKKSASSRREARPGESSAA